MNLSAPEQYTFLISSISPWLYAATSLGLEEPCCVDKKLNLWLVFDPVRRQKSNRTKKSGKRSNQGFESGKQPIIKSNEEKRALDRQGGGMEGSEIEEGSFDSQEGKDRSEPGRSMRGRELKKLEGGMKTKGGS